MKQTAAIKFCFKYGKIEKEMVSIMQIVYGEDCLAIIKYLSGMHVLKIVVTPLQHDPREGCPSTSTTNENVKLVHELLAKCSNVIKRAQYQYG